jgi:hypothetical protein
MSAPETLTLRATAIAGERYADDYAVIWRGMSVGRIMLGNGHRTTGRNGHGPATSTADRRAVTTGAALPISPTRRRDSRRPGRASARA